MKVTFIGAAKTVTGSCYLIETDAKKNILVDCGMFQGHDQEFVLNAEEFVFNPSNIDYVLLTHAHIDHTGRIPKLVKDGFNGEILTTKATSDLCGIMLPDSGHIQEVENKWINVKRARAGKKPVEPLYTAQDATDSLKYFNSINYDEVIDLPGNIKVKFNDAGHMLGSSIIEIWVNENGLETKLVFTGDLGNSHLPLLRDKSIIENADYLFIESTYGDRLHKDVNGKAERFLNIINETIDKGGNVVIPSFAVGRTQEIIYELHDEKHKFGDKLKKLFDIPVYVDSPLAVSATEVFRKNLDYLNEEAKAYIENGDNPLDFSNLKFARTSEESIALNESKEKMIIISASGMCEAGRIKHHIKHNIWRPECTILFVGYQAPGTLGRKIVDGAKTIKIYGEEVSVNARIEMIDGFSGHADQKGLLDWLKNFKKAPKKVFIIHGEKDAQTEFSKKIKEDFDWDTIIPERGDSYSIIGDRCFISSENKEAKFKYSRLATLIEMEDIRREFNELLKVYKRSLKDDTRDDSEIEQVRLKIQQLKEYIISLIK